jgi:hypothetical protein
MAGMTDHSFTSSAIVPSTSRLAIGQQRADDASLGRSARSLGDAARAFREASDAPQDPEDLTRAFALIEEALDDLAAGTELIAYVAIEGSRRRRAGATDGRPLVTARALSWRLHGLRSGLVAARRICTELTRVLDGAVRR